MAGSLPNIGVAAQVAGLSTFMDGLAAVNRAVQQAGETILAQAAATGELEGATQGGSEALSLMSVMSAGLVVAVAAVVGIIAEAVTQLDQVQGALVRVAAQTGQSTSELGPFRKSMEDLFRTGLVDNWNEAAKAVQLTTEKIPGLKAGAADTLAFATAAEGMAKAWGVPVEGVIDSAQKLITAFPKAGLSGQQALDLITTTAQHSHLSLDQVDQIITGYGSKFSGAGLSAMGMSGLIALAANTGITNFSGLGLAVDTFAKEVANPPKGFAATLQDMGLTKTVADLKTNKIDMDTALDAIYTKFSTMPDGPNKTADAIKLFGSRVEQLGGPEALGRLAGFTGAFSDMQGSAENVAKVMADDGTFGTAIHQFGANVKVDVEQAAQTAFTNIKSINWTEISTDLGIMWDTAGKTVSAWLTGVEKFINDAKDRIVNAVNTLVSDATATWNAVFGPTGSASTAVTDALNALRDAPGKIAQAVGTEFSKIAAAAIGALAPIINFINQIIIAINALAGLPGSPLAGVHIAPLAGVTGVPGAPGVSMNAGVAAHAGGGALDEGWNLVGEKGAELIWKAGAVTQVIPNAMPMMSSNSTMNQTNNNQRNMTVNMNGVKGADDAVAKFSMMFASRKL
jgi:hypothetical protein